MTDKSTKADSATDLVLVANPIVQPSSYFDQQRKELTERLNEIKLDESTKQKIARDAGGKLIRDKILGSFKIGAVISTILNWNETVQKDIKSFKKDTLLAMYFDKSDANEEALDALKKFITNPQGNAIFNKIIRILDDNSPDLELMGHLATALKNMAQNKFREMFEDHKIALSLIEELSPQALTIVADYNSWPEINLDSYSATGGRLTSDYVNEFAETYVWSKAINDARLARMVAHSISDLVVKRLIQADLVREKVAKCSLTEIGKMLARYLV